MKKSIYLILFVALLFQACKSKKVVKGFLLPITVFEVDSIPREHLVYKIDSINNYNILYTKNENKDYKIVYDKKLFEGCFYVEKKYNLILETILTNSWVEGKKIHINNYALDYVVLNDSTLIYRDESIGKIHRINSKYNIPCSERP